MNDPNRSLGICIPTYKRPDQLRQCVLSIIAAAEPYDVPVYILDDSTDDTNTEALLELRNRYPHIVYRKNERNLGIDRNIVASVDACECDYAWIMGEDDRMKPDAVRVALAALETSPAFVCANYAYVDDAVSIILREKQLDITDDLVLSDEEFLRTHAWAIGFIGACIVDKGLWKAVDKTRYIGTYYAHAGVILESLAGRKALVLAKPLVLNRVGNAETFTWSGDSYGVMTGWVRMCRLLEPFYDAEICRAAADAFLQNHGLTSIKLLCSQRADRVYDMSAYRRYFRDADRGRMYHLLARLVAVAPPAPFRFARSVYHYVRRRKAVAAMSVPGDQLLI